MDAEEIRQIAQQAGIDIENTFNRVQQAELNKLFSAIEESRKTSQVEPVKSWEPKGGEWFIDFFGQVRHASSTGDYRLFGSEFQTEEEAERASKFVSRQLWMFHLAEELNDGWVPDWEDKYQLKVCLRFSHDIERWVMYVSGCEKYETVYFSREAAEKAVELLNSGKVVLP